MEGNSRPSSVGAVQGSDEEGGPTFDTMSAQKLQMGDKRGKIVGKKSVTFGDVTKKGIPKKGGKKLDELADMEVAELTGKMDPLSLSPPEPPARPRAVRLESDPSLDRLESDPSLDTPQTPFSRPSGAPARSMVGSAPPTVGPAPSPTGAVVGGPVDTKAEQKLESGDKRGQVTEGGKVSAFSQGGGKKKRKKSKRRKHSKRRKYSKKRKSTKKNKKSKRKSKRR